MSSHSIINSMSIQCQFNHQFNVNSINKINVTQSTHPTSVQAVANSITNSITNSINNSITNAITNSMSILSQFIQ